MSILKDVAHKVGVSVQTVSNVVNGREVVHPKTKARVLQALAELDYHPNLAARELRYQISQTIGFLVVDPSPRYLADPFHNEVVTGLADAVREHDYRLLIHNILPEDDPTQLLLPFRQRRVDGGVITMAGSVEMRQRYLDQIMANKQAYVLLEQRLAASHVACILGENRRGAYAATEYLIGKGHRAIGFLSGSLVWPAVEERVRGYQEALQAHQCPAGPDLLAYCDWETPQSAFQATLKLLQSRPDVTAILGGNDLLAVGAMQAIQSLGRTVPADMAVVGFDDFEFAQYVRPRLTTVSLPGYEMGRQAAELLLEYFQTGQFTTPEISLPTRLIIRESS